VARKTFPPTVQYRTSNHCERLCALKMPHCLADLVENLFSTGRSFYLGKKQFLLFVTHRSKGSSKNKVPVTQIDLLIDLLALNVVAGL
jgi:hypothetical protein